MGDYNIHSSDRIRGELFGDENNQENNSLVFETLHNRVKEDLKNKKSCCYDATNIVAKRRRAFLQEIKGISCYKICYVIATPYDICLHNNSNRNRVVGENIINRFYKSFNIPTAREGWDEIHLIYNFAERGYYNGKEIIDRLSDIDQCNPHHSLTIGDHCKLCEENVKNDPRFQELNYVQQEILETAALYHDIGKEKTATFINKKGETTEVCHFYDHENVGAYDSLFLDDMNEFTKNEILTVADLIQLHMKMYSNPDSTKYKEKLHRQLGDELYGMLKILYDADRNAK